MSTTTLSTPSTRTRPLDDRWIAVLLLVASLALRLPFRAQFLVNWDAVNFALGIVDFDLATHQPHPPGYLGFVAVGRLGNALVGDPNAAMTMLSVLSGAVATALAYLLARRFVARRHALLAAVLFSTAPLAWYYSVVALSYMTTGAVVLGMLLAAVIALQRRSVTHVLVASGLLAVVGALRPTDQVLLLPAWIVLLAAFDWRTRGRATAVMAAASLAWFVPLMWLSGGPLAFLRQSSALADLAGTRTMIFSGNLAGMVQNVGLVASGLLLGLFGGLVVLVVARLRGIRPWAGLPRRIRHLLIASVVPALAVYLLLHTGQLGYVIMLLPAAYVGVARALPRLAPSGPRSAPTGASRRSPPLGRRRWRISAGVVAFLLVVNAAGFLLLPGAGLRAVEAATRAEVMVADQEVVDGPLVLNRTRQYDVAANDRHWEALLAGLGDHDPEITAVLAETTSAGSFRHLSFYAEDYAVFGAGWDKAGELGFLFRAQDQRTTYSVDQLGHAKPAVALPQDVRTVVIADLELASALAETGIATVDEQVLDDGSSVVVVELAEPAGLLFENAGGPDGLAGRDGIATADRRSIEKHLAASLASATQIADDADEPGRVATMAFVPREVAEAVAPDSPSTPIRGGVIPAS